MKNKAEILAILKKEKQSLMQQWPLASMALFGSVARNENRDDSDIDLLVDITAPMGWQFFDMVSAFEALLGSRVDLVDRSQIQPKAWPYIQGDLIDV